MTQKDIYTKFMIEYDKANVTSSYPSLTEYEVATVLDKAYNALIAQKVTGNNVRRVGLEQDLKSIEDISPLIKNVTVSSASRITIENSIANNVESIQLESDHLYFLNCYLKYTTSDTPMDGEVNRMVPVQLGSHQMASKFFSSAYNLPWIKTPVGYIEDDKLFVVYDPINKPKMSANKFDNPQLVYIKTPSKFVKDFINATLPTIREKVVDFVQKKFNTTLSSAVISGIEDALDSMTEWSYFTNPSISYDTDTDAHIQGGQYVREYLTEMYTFECSDTMAEELISLAVAFALENVESQRLNSKLNMRGLEA